MRTLIALIALSIVACSQKEPALKLRYLKSFEISAICEEIHIKQPFKYEGAINVIEMNSKQRPVYVVSMGYVTRIKMTNIGEEIMQQAKNPRLYLPPTTVSFNVENDDILKQSTLVFSGSAKTTGDGDTLMDCTVKVEREAPLPK